MAKTLSDYLLAAKKEHRFRIKFAFQPKAVDQDRLERHLRKYDLIEVSPMSKTMFQTNPIDFGDIRNTEVWVMDIVIGFAVPSYVLKEEIRQLFKVSEKFIVVRGEHDPLQDQADELIDQEDDVVSLPDDKKSEAKMDDPFYEKEPAIKATDFYGDEYNEEMLKVFREEKAKLDNRYAKYDYPAGQGLFPDVSLDKDVKADAGPTKLVELVHQFRHDIRNNGE
jgi:hypothetical protein